jgi:RsiW-degrading membrane proteinase PrsW (M82 family)
VTGPVITNAVVGLAPVVLFLAALSAMDSFKLVRPREVAVALAWGAVAAGISLSIHSWVVATLHVPTAIVSRYIAPVTEETAKACLIVGLIAVRRVGFPVDAAVQGFAVGTGFALVENLGYLQVLPDASLLLWLVRGLGTAVLQGATTAILAMISKTLSDRFPERGIAVFLPGWAFAVVLHSVFNHRFLPPVAQTLLLLVLLPILVLLVFARSERATREWIGAGMDLDIELLQLVQSEHFPSTRFGQYLARLRSQLPGLVIADMFCLLRLELELAVQAKALLVARDSGLELEPDGDLEVMLAERRFLERSIGTAGLLALRPLQITSHRDLWHQFLLRQNAKRQA